MDMSGSNIDLLSITTGSSASFGIDGLSGIERLNRPFEYHAQLHSGTELLDPTTLMDNVATVTIGDPTGLGRYVSGIVSAVSQLPSQSTNLWRYSLTIVPALWFLGQTSDCRFYQSMTVPAIAAAILGQFSVTFENQLQGTYSTRDYVVMYNESYLHFLQRILEDEGIFYFFVHADGSHKMILGDTNSVFTPIANPDLMLQDQGAVWSGVSTIRRVDSTALGQVTVDDYNPATDTLAPAALRGQVSAGIEGMKLPSGSSTRTHYSWPAVRPTTTDAGTRAKWRVEAAEAASQLFQGTAGSPDFVVGGTFTLTNDPIGIENYVIHTVSYNVTDMAKGSSSNGASQLSCSFVAFPASTTWRETPSTTPPVMAGLYTALVIGAPGEEIYTDSLGRIQVWFPWDRNGDIKAASTFWARVVQPWAGVAWGHQFIPRVGMEVAVGFLEGDVNRPVVVGSLVNKDNTPVFPVAKKNISGIRTRSTTGGSSTTFNELSWDDTLGGEVFYLHAEKDYLLETENDQTLKIDNCRFVTVKKDETVKIDGKQTITVKGDQTIEIKEGNHKFTVDKGNHTVEVSEGNQSLTIDKGNQTIEVSEGDRKVTVDKGNHTVTVSMGNEKHDVTAGSITVTAGQSISHKATESITLTVGGNSLKIDQTGVTINGMMFKVSASGMMQLSASGMAQVSASGPLTLSGALINIG
jgi:type VI secretion system secreted protein VgrG